MHWMHDMPGGGDATASGGAPGLLHVDVGFVGSPARAAIAASIHRFDFEGNLLPPDIQVPVHAGLHHHGKDESRPGYTLEEVGILARSQMPSQRVIALRTLAHVARKLKSARYPPSLSGTLARVFFKDIRLPLLLRTALDDSNATVVSSAVECLHALLVDPREEELYQVLWTTLRGVEAFPLLPDSTLPFFASAEGLVKADEETPDEDVARRDLVRGLLRMNLLPRLRYLLEVARLETAVVEGIFDVLIRVARHSPAAAHLVAECPRLWPCVRLLFIEVFPDTFSQAGGDGEGEVRGDEGGAVAYVHPLPKAIELVRVLCQASRVLAERCVEEGLLDSLMRFVVGGTLVPTHAAHALFIEAVRAWTACALYGLHVHAFPNLFPHLLPHAALSSLSSPSALARSAAVLPLFHALTAAASSSSSDGEGAVAWAQVASLTEAPTASLPALVSALVGALSSPSSEDRVQARATLPRLRALAATLHLMATHWELAPRPTPTRQQQQPRSQADNGDDETAVVWARPLLQAVPSLVPLLLSLAADHSPLWRVAGEEDGIHHHHHHHHQVPAAGLVEEVGYPSRLESYALHVGAADAVAALLRLLRALLHRAPSLARHVLLTDTVGWARQLLQGCLDHGLQQEALLPSAAGAGAGAAAAGATAKTAGHWRRLFAKRPLVLAAVQALLYLLAVEAVHLRGTAPQPLNGDGGGGGPLKAHERTEEEDEEERRWLLTCACQLLPRLPPGDYPYALQLVEEVVLQPRFLLLGAATRAQEADEAAVGVCRTLAHFYAAALDPYVKSSLAAVGRTGGWRRDHLLVPVDESPELPLADATAWMFLPVAHYHALLSLASRALPDDDDDDDGNRHEEDVAPPPDLIKAALAFLTLLEQAAPPVMTAIPVAIKCYELMKVFFLASGALVFDEAVAAPLRHLFGRYCPDLPYPTSAVEATSAAGLVAFEQEVPHFYGFFSRLVDHFRSSSYGHPVFARALWLLLDMRQPPQYRTLLWTELLDSLHLLHLPESEVPVGRHWYLYPAESDPEMVRLYEAALTSPRGLSAVRSPTLYAVAIHHVATHLFALPAPVPFPPAPAASSSSASSSPSSWQRVLLLQRLLDDASSETCVRDLCFYEPWAGEGPLLPDRAAGRSASDVRPAVRELLEAAASSSPAVRKRLQELSLLL